jgi:hypothetical protein
VNELAAGQLDAEAWQQRCAELGIAGLPLDHPAPVAPPSSSAGSS